ncbi:MAG: glycosyltransferase family protein, partial [Nanoarchaeota archaeon]
LNKLDETFYVYGFGKKRARKHLTFFNFSEDGFIQHLASAKAVIIGGGLSLMSEAIYLKKPVFSVPLRNHYEQIMNAYYLQKLKFGEHHQKPQLVDVHDFLLKLDLYQHYLGQYNFDPSEFPRKVEQVSRKAKKEPSRKRLRALQRILFAQ